MCDQGFHVLSYLWPKLGPRSFALTHVNESCLIDRSFALTSATIQVRRYKCDDSTRVNSHMSGFHLTCVVSLLHLWLPSHICLLALYVYLPYHVCGIPLKCVLSISHVWPIQASSTLSHVWYDAFTFLTWCSCTWHDWFIFVTCLLHNLPHTESTPRVRVAVSCSLLQCAHSLLPHPVSLPRVHDTVHCIVLHCGLVWCSGHSLWVALECVLHDVAVCRSLL